MSIEQTLTEIEQGKETLTGIMPGGIRNLGKVQGVYVNATYTNGTVVQIQANNIKLTANMDVTGSRRTYDFHLYVDDCGEYCSLDVFTIFPNIKDVIYKDPATIVLWKDGSKTVVKCQKGDTYDPEKGLVMCIIKKICGNKGNYNNEIKKWLPAKQAKGKVKTCESSRKKTKQ